jgi:hypothetical protein
MLLRPLLGILLCVPAAQAQDIRWISPAGGSFSEPANWEGGVVPTQTPPHYPRPARFDLEATYTVTAGDIAVDGLRFGGGCHVRTRACEHSAHRDRNVGWAKDAGASCVGKLEL